MPGIFDPNQNSGILSGLANLFASAQRGASGPAGQEMGFRQGAYNALAQELGPGQAALAVGAPEAFNAAWQRQLFMGQLQDMQKRYPNMGLNELLYRMSQGGQKEQYGVTPVPGFKTPSGAEAPGMIQGGAIQPPPGMGFNNPQPASQTTAPPSTMVGQPQAVSGQGGPATAGISPIDQQGINYKSGLAGAEETARKQADRLDQYHGALADAQDTVSKLEAFKSNPDRPSIIGGLLGVFGRLGPVGQKQADLVNQNDELQSKIMNSVRTLGGIATGRQMTPGTIKEMSVGAGDLIVARKGTLEGHTQTIDNAIDLIKKRTQAAWVATGKKGEQPTWGSPAPQQYPEGTIAHNKQTGETRVMRAGRWQ